MSELAIFRLPDPDDNFLPANWHDPIQEVMKRFYKTVDAAVQEALWQRVEHGWKAEPVIYSFTHDPLRKSVRITEGDQIVFRQDVVIRPPSF